MVLFIFCTHINNIISNFIRGMYCFKFSKIIGFIISSVNHFTFINLFFFFFNSFCFINSSKFTLFLPFIDGNCLSEDSKDFKASNCFFLNLQLFSFVFQKLFLKENRYIWPALLFAFD